MAVSGASIARDVVRRLEARTMSQQLSPVGGESNQAAPICYDNEGWLREN